jgi:hypothetical protein
MPDAVPDRVQTKQITPGPRPRGHLPVFVRACAACFSHDVGVIRQCQGLTTDLGGQTTPQLCKQSDLLSSTWALRAGTGPFREEMQCLVVKMRGRRGASDWQGTASDYTRNGMRPRSRPRGRCYVSEMVTFLKRA